MKCWFHNFPLSCIVALDPDIFACVPLGWIQAEGLLGTPSQPLHFSGWWPLVFPIPNLIFRIEIRRVILPSAFISFFLWPLLSWKGKLMACDHARKQLPLFLPECVHMELRERKQAREREKWITHLVGWRADSPSKEFVRAAWREMRGERRPCSFAAVHFGAAICGAHSWPSWHPREGE